MSTLSTFISDGLSRTILAMFGVVGIMGNNYALEYVL